VVHTWRSQNELIKGGMKQNLCGKRPQERHIVRWEDIIKKDGGGLKWKEKATDKERQRTGCEMLCP